jgi:acyl-CoA thioester hydrolase
MKNVFIWPVRVYYEDTDAGGVVFNANYLKFFERARTEWLRQIDVDATRMREQFQCMFVVKAINVEYHAPARLDDELQVTSLVQKTGRASIVFAQEARISDKLLASATVTICCVSIDEWKPIKVPDSILKSMLENNP